MRKIPLAIRILVAAILFIAVLFAVFGYLGDYREAKRSGPSRPPTSSPDATGTSKPGTTSGAGRDVMTGSSGATVTVLIEGLNLRTKPESDAEVIKGLSRNERLKWLSSRTGWYQVVDGENHSGWVSSNPQYTKLER